MCGWERERGADGFAAGITENRAMVLHSILVDGFGSFTCYIPVLTPDVL